MVKEKRTSLFFYSFGLQTGMKSGASGAAGSRIPVTPFLSFLSKGAFKAHIFTVPHWVYLALPAGNPTWCWQRGMAASRPLSPPAATGQEGNSRPCDSSRSPVSGPGQRRRSLLDKHKCSITAHILLFRQIQLLIIIIICNHLLEFAQVQVQVQVQVHRDSSLRLPHLTLHSFGVKAQGLAIVLKAHG